MSRRPTRVLVLGGGLAGVATAFRLSHTPALRQRFQVTLLQQGHRLGGKGATGWNEAEGGRVEEHGLHVWMGFYQTAFGLLRDIYGACETAERPFSSLSEAFIPRWEASLGSTDAALHLRLPHKSGLPWHTSASARLPAPGLLSRWLCYANELWRDHRAGRRILPPLGASASLIAAVSRGLAALAKVPQSKWQQALDEYDLRQWLRIHGATEAAATHPAIEAFYALAFAYPDGASGLGRGSVAAGAALSSIARILFAYKGAPFWFMRVGMGDTVFAPAYRALRRHGAEVRFFHRVHLLKVASDAPRIDRVVVRVQADVAQYEPLLRPGAHEVWPSEPRWEQLPAPLGQRRPNFEAWACEEGSLQSLHVGRDFDVVVLAIPVDAHPRIAPDVMAASPAFARMVRAHRSVATRALQVWLHPDRSTLGVEGPANVFSNLTGPFTSAGDLSCILPFEGWSNSSLSSHSISSSLSLFSSRGISPKTVLYFVDAATPTTLGEQGATANGENALNAIRSLPGRPDVANGHIISVYERLNADHSERYILTPPGSTRHRLRAGESGIFNLILAGDWTRTSINGGSVEAAAESGEEAAREIVRRYTN